MFDYQHKVDKRAKSIKLKICPYRGLIITAPRKLSSNKLQKVLTSHQSWISTFLKQNKMNSHVEKPDLLKLEVNTKEIEIRYEKSNLNRVKFESNQLLVQFNDDSKCIELLRKWIRKQAFEYFQSRLDYWSEKTQLKYKKLTVRSQKSRWGSYSSNGTLSLNDQLIFMPMSVLDYIIIHELCHSVEQNHSFRFWALVSRYYPNYKNEEMNLNANKSNIPNWFKLSMYQ